MAPRPFVPKNGRSLWRTFVPQEGKFQELSFPCPFVLGNFRSRGTKVPGNFRSLDLSFPGTFVSRALQFSAHFYCRQMVGCIKMPLGIEVGLSPDELPLRGTAPQFLSSVRCGQTTGWMKTPLDTEVELGPGHIVLDWVPALPERGTAAPHLFGACLLWTRSPISATAELLYKQSPKNYTRSPYKCQCRSMHSKSNKYIYNYLIHNTHGECSVLPFQQWWRRKLLEDFGFMFKGSDTLESFLLKVASHLTLYIGRPAFAARLSVSDVPMTVARRTRRLKTNTTRPTTKQILTVAIGVCIHS